MEELLRKYGWALTMLFIAIGAALAAQGLNNIVASKLAPLTVPELPEVAPEEGSGGGRAARSASSARNWDAKIVPRCFFGCEDGAAPAACPGGCAEGESCQQGVCVPDQPAEQITDSSLPVPSDAPLKLLGTMSAEDAQYSMALILDDDSSQTHVVSADDYIGQDILIVEVRRDRVILERAGRLEFIRMANSIAGNPTPVSVRPAPTPRSDIPNLAQPSQARAAVFGQPAAREDNGINKVDDSTFQIDRASIERRMENPKALASQGRIIPNNDRDGNRAGLKIVGIPADSIYRDIGIQSGDVLRGVNGNEVNTQQEALELLKKLQNEGEVEIQIERRGKPKQLKYNID